MSAKWGIVTFGAPAALMNGRNMREPSPDFEKQLAGYGLTTAEILYRIPDHPTFLQSYLWQDYDIAPGFPTLMKFLAFWRQKLDGSLHSVRIGHARLIRPAEIRTFDTELMLH